MKCLDATLFHYGSHSGIPYAVGSSSFLISCAKTTFCRFQHHIY